MLRHRPRQVGAAVPLVPSPLGRGRRRPVDSLDRVDQASCEDVAPGLPVGKHVETALPLKLDCLVDRSILDALVVADRKRAARELAPSGSEVVRPEQRSDVLGPKGHAANLVGASGGRARSVPATGTARL